MLGYVGPLRTMPSLQTVKELEFFRMTKESGLSGSTCLTHGGRPSLIESPKKLFIKL